MNEEDWKAKLTPDQYRVLRQKGTEAPFSGELLNEKRKGMYACSACGATLFSSDAKHESRMSGLQGWPSFAEVAETGAVKLVSDDSVGMHRTEVVCSNCGGHLGHLFEGVDDTPTGKHYCINSVCLKFEPQKEVDYWHDKTTHSYSKNGWDNRVFDPAYDAMNKNLMKVDASIESYLHNLIKPHFNFSTESVTEKDSRDITKEDRNKLAETIEATTHANIVITHGTFTMVETAQFLEKRAFTDKKIILTGSMVPISGFSVSDAGFNLGFTVASFANVHPGFFVCMNGGIFTPNEVKKNPELFRFE